MCIIMSHGWVGICNSKQYNSGGGGGGGGGGDTYNVAMNGVFP